MANDFVQMKIQQMRKFGMPETEIMSQVGGYAGGYTPPPSSAASAPTLQSQQFKTLTPEQETVQSRMLSGEMYSPETAQTYFRSVFEPEYALAGPRAQQQAKAGFAGPGYWGSSRALAQERASRGVERERGIQYGKVMMDWEQAKREAMARALQIPAFETQTYWNPERFKPPSRTTFSYKGPWIT